MPDAVGARRPASGRLVLTAGLLVVVFYLLHVSIYWSQINDDAFITFRYSKFLLLGRGPYFNIGQHVEGYSSPLMMLLMAAALALFGDDDLLFVAKLTGVAGGLAAILAGWALTRRWLGRIESLAPQAGLLAWTGAALAAGNCGYTLNTTTGLETTIFAAELMIGLWLVQKALDERRYRLAGVAFALASLTRPEGALIFAAVFLARLIAGELRSRPGRRALLADALLVAGAVVAQLVARYLLYDGELLPNTYYAKRGGIAWHMSGLEYVHEFAVRTLGAVVPLLAILPWLARERLLRRQTLPALAAVWASVAAVLLTGADWMPGYRLLVALVPAWGALAICGVGALADRLRRGSLTLTTAVAGLLMLGVFWWQSDLREAYYRYCVIRAAGYTEGHVALAEWLDRQLAPGATVALMDIGIVGFRCPELRILDITGLTDRHIARSPGGFLDKHFDVSYVFDQRPEVLVIAVSGPPGSLDETRFNELEPWSAIEARLVSAPRFRQHYLRPRTPDYKAPDLERLAAVCGAERIFRHHYPGRSYLLLVYRYHAPPAVPTSGPGAET